MQLSSEISCNNMICTGKAAIRHLRNGWIPNHISALQSDDLIDMCTCKSYYGCTLNLPLVNLPLVIHIHILFSTVHATAGNQMHCGWLWTFLTTCNQYTSMQFEDKPNILWIALDNTTYNMLLKITQIHCECLWTILLTIACNDGGKGQLTLLKKSYRPISSKAYSLFNLVSPESVNCEYITIYDQAIYHPLQSWKQAFYCYCISLYSVSLCRIETVPPSSHPSLV